MLGEVIHLSHHSYNIKVTFKMELLGWNTEGTFHVFSLNFSDGYFHFFYCHEFDKLKTNDVILIRVERSLISVLFLYVW